MDFSLRHFKLRALADFLVLAVILGFVTHCAYLKIDSMLKESLEEAVALNSRSIAVGLNNQFEQEFKKLNAITYAIENRIISLEDLEAAVMFEENSEEIGIVTENNEAIFGPPLPQIIEKRFEKVFAGENFVTYQYDAGLTFAIPIKIDGQNCLLYERIPTNNVKEKFHAISYNGSGTVILLNSMKDWMIISDGDELINVEPEMEKNWSALAKKINSNPNAKSWSVFGTFEGKRYFIYLAEISTKYNFAISGYVSWEKAAVGIDYIYSVMLGTFFLIFLFLIFGVRYMFKSRQAKFFEKEKILADSANQAKSSFLSNMSHEIRTPINAIMGMNEMVIRESNDPAILEYSENLQNAAKTLLGLVNDILDFSKIEAGKMEIIPVEYSLSSLLNDLVNMIQTRANKKGLTFKINAERTLPTELYGDEIRLKQIVTNILTNAVKYTENGSVILTVTGKKVFGENKVKMIFSVKDTGIGIKEEDIKKLFSAFERIEEKRNRSVEGTGLGMNITQRLLTMMGSTLQVHSVYGEGSEFTFEVEQKIVNPHPLGNFEENYKHALSQHKKYREKFTAPKAKILVVDDTVMNLTVVKGLLKQTKIQIDTADSGYEALTMVTKKRYDLIFLDHRMPGLDGIETLQHMKDLPGNLNHDVPTISLTANAISGARKQYIDAGFQDYLTKPIDSDKLESMLIEYLPAEKVHLHKNDDEDPDETADEKTLPDWLNSVEGLNAQDGIKHCGSVDAYLDALTVFAQSVTSGAKEIADFYKNEDWKNYTTKVHALKSSARVIGANELSSRALRLEDAGNSGYINEIKESTDYLLELYISFADKLAPLIKTDSEDDENKPLIGDDELAEAYETLKEVAATFDYDTLMFVIQSVEEYKLPDAEKEKFSEIKSAAAKPDWETLQKLLK